MTQAPKSLKDIRALVIGDEIQVGALFHGLDRDQQLQLRLIEIEIDGVRVFDATYRKIKLGQVTLTGQKWSASWN